MAEWYSVGPKGGEKKKMEAKKKSNYFRHFNGKLNLSTLFVPGRQSGHHQGSQPVAVCLQQGQCGLWHAQSKGKD